MGQLEKAARMQRRIGYVQYAILSAIAITGILAVGMLAPNVLQLLGKMPGNKYRFKNQSQNVLTRLARQGYIIFEERGDTRYARITDAGKRILILNGATLAQRAKKGKRWDKRWRVVIFDIPERRRQTRDTLRAMMKSFGFVRLQDSAWIYPYDCEDVVALLKAELKTGAAVLYIIVEKLENDQRFREHFDLH